MVTGRRTAPRCSAVRASTPILPGGAGPAALATVVLGVAGLVVLLVPRRGHAAAAARGDDPVATVRRLEVGLQLVAALGVSIALLGLVGFSLLDRYVAFTLPAVLVAVAVGLVGLVHLARRGRELVATGVVARAAGRRGRGWPAAARTETLLPRQEFAGVVDEVGRRSTRRPSSSAGSHVGYAWYLDGRDLDVRRTDDGDEATETLLRRATDPPCTCPTRTRNRSDGPACLDEAARRSLPQSGDNVLGPGGEMVWYELR